jgi:RNA polymerase-interacting CarD/CdnL/TRCF family regulator
VFLLFSRLKKRRKEKGESGICFDVATVVQQEQKRKEQKEQSRVFTDLFYHGNKAGRENFFSPWPAAS